MLDFVVGRAPANEGAWREKARTATRMLVKGLSLSNSNAEVRKKVILGVREALGETSDEAMVQMVDVPASKSGPAERGPALSTAGIYRMILDNERVDRRDPMTAESFMVVVQRTLDMELASID